MSFVVNLAICMKFGTECLWEDDNGGCGAAARIPAIHEPPRPLSGHIPRIIYDWRHIIMPRGRTGQPLPPTGPQRPPTS